VPDWLRHVKRSQWSGWTWVHMDDLMLQSAFEVIVYTRPGAEINLEPSCQHFHLEKFLHPKPSSRASAWPKWAEPGKQLKVSILYPRHLRMFQKVESKIWTQRMFDMRMFGTKRCRLQKSDFTCWNANVSRRMYVYMCVCIVRP
jgi:hypothetical protein